MYKKIATILLLFLMIIIGLSACNKTEKGKDANYQTNKGTKGNETKETSDNNQTIMGRYMEHKVEFPVLGKNEKVLKILQNPDKKIELITKSKEGYFSYLLQEDQSWQKDTPGWLNDATVKNENDYFADLCLGKDGNYYASFENYDDGARSFLIKSEDGGNTAKRLEIPCLNSMKNTSSGTDIYPLIRNLEVTQNGTLVLYDIGNTILIVSAEGELLDKIDMDGDRNFTTAGDDVIGVDDEDSGIFYYNTVTKKMEKNIEFELGKDYLAYQLAYAVKEDGTLLLGDNKGIHRLASGGTLWETMVDGALNSMSMPTLTFDALFTYGEEQEEYYAVYISNEGEFQLNHYQFDSTVSAVPSKEITVYSLKENNTIRQAISLYQAKNADIKVNYIVAMGEDGNVADYIRALNSELLAGNGADILILDGLPVDSYIEKGVLEDLSDVVVPAMKEGEFLNNIAGGIVRDGAYYNVPIRFTIPIVVGNQKALQAIGSVKEIADYIGSSHSLPYSKSGSYKTLLQDYITLYSEEIFEDGTYSQDKLKTFLKNMKVVAENTGATKTGDEQGEDQDMSDGLYDVFRLFQGDIFGLTIPQYDTATMQIKSVFDSSLLFALTGDYGMKYSLVNDSFLPVGEVGLNHACKDKLTAHRFISFLFSQEVQNSNLYDGFPVNSISLQKWFDEEKSDFSLGIGGRDNIMISAYWPTKEERKELQERTLKASRPIVIDQTKAGILIDGAIPYLDGEIDLDQAVSAIGIKLKTYMSE